MTLNNAVEATVVSVGLGTYFGFIFVFLKSSPTIEVPRGTITPPLILLNLYKILSSCVISKLDVKSSDRVVCAAVSAPEGDTAVAVPLTSLTAKPGLLSNSCSPGYTNIVVLSIKSLFSPFTYENLADSSKALCIVLNGAASELP